MKIREAHLKNKKGRQTNKKKSQYEIVIFESYNNFTEVNP